MEWQPCARRRRRLQLGARDAAEARAHRGELRVHRVGRIRGGGGGGAASDGVRLADAAGLYKLTSVGPLLESARFQPPSTYGIKKNKLIEKSQSHPACTATTRRQPWRYKRDADGGVSIPQLGGWSTGPLEALRGKDALVTAAMLVQEELCLVREETSEDRGLEEEEGEDAHTFEAGVVCFSFDPRKRHHKTLAQVHRPVPGYEVRSCTDTTRANGYNKKTT